MESLFVDPVEALGLPTVELTGDDAVRVGHGSALERTMRTRSGRYEADQNLAVTHDGVLLGVYARSGGQLKAQVVIPGGVGGAR